MRTENTHGSESDRQCGEAWRAIVATLDELAPAWGECASRPMDAAVQTLRERLATTPPPLAGDGGEAVSVGDWLWLKLTEWCKSKGIAPHQENSLFSIVREARERFDNTATPSQARVREVGEEDARAVCDAERLHHTSVPRVLSVLQERFPNGVATGDSHGLRMEEGMDTHGSAVRELKPCPFCGTHNVAIQPIRDGKKVVCSTCHAEGPSIHHGREGWQAAINAAKDHWNSRPYEEPTAAAPGEEKCKRCEGRGIVPVADGYSVDPCPDCAHPQLAVAPGEDGITLGAGDFYGSGAELPKLHDDPLTNREIQVQALSARLDVARQALAACAAMQVVNPVLQTIKANAAWALNETNPSRVLPRSFGEFAHPQLAGEEAVAEWTPCDYCEGTGIPRGYQSLCGHCGGSGRSPAPSLAGQTHSAPGGDDAIECHGLDTPERVCFYEQDFYVLSNFSAFSIMWEKSKREGLVRFETSEAVYHWMKFHPNVPTTEQYRLMEEIRLAPSAHEAFKLAERNKHLRRPDWDNVKVDIMRDILRAKARQHEYVRRKLLATGNRDLVENSWRDSYWGWGPNRDGLNMLGKLWMEVRAELRAIDAAIAKDSV